MDNVIVNKILEDLSVLTEEAKEQAEFRGRTDEHFNTLNGRVGTMEGKVECLEKETAVGRYLTKNPKITAILLIAFVSAVFGLEIKTFLGL